MYKLRGILLDSNIYIGQLCTTGSHDSHPRDLQIPPDLEIGGAYNGRIDFLQVLPQRL